MGQAIVQRIKISSAPGQDGWTHCSVALQSPVCMESQGRGRPGSTVHSWACQTFCQARILHPKQPPSAHKRHFPELREATSIEGLHGFLGSSLCDDKSHQLSSMGAARQVPSFPGGSVSLVFVNRSSLDFQVVLLYALLWQSVSDQSRHFPEDVPL